jgi:hypothetical protein
MSKNTKIRIYETIILSEVLYETSSLTLREGHRVRVFENRVLRRIFVPKRDEVTGGWRKLHNEELCDLYSCIIRMSKSMRFRWMGQVARMRRRGMHIGCWYERDHHENQDVGLWIILRWILER